MDTKKLLDECHRIVKVNQNEFYSRLELECKIVLFESGLELPCTPEEVKAAGYVVVYTPDGAARICKEGKVVSNIIYPLPLFDDYER